MLSSAVTLGCLAVAGLVSAQSATTTGGSGYVGYNLTLEGPEGSAIFSTEETNPDAGSQYPDPDVYLNASLYVGEIDIEVDNITAKVNLDAQVLSLLKFNAGVDVSIDRVNLLIQNVTAKVLLEARLENVVQMIGDVLDSLDLNPVIATLGQDVGNIVSTAVGGLEGTASGALSGLERRSFELQQNIIYSTNNYVGNVHTNRILEQNGDIVDERLDNDGHLHGQSIIGTYQSLMTFNGHESTTQFHGQEVTEREYTYTPFHGITSVSAVYTNADGKVVGTRVLVESNAGGSSTISDL